MNRPEARTVALLLGLLLACGTGCGDDDAVVHMDGGPMDGGGAGSAGRNSGMIGRRDAQVTPDDPVPICDRAEPVPCGAGQKCHPVRRRAAGEAQYTLYTGCIEDRGGRELGAPCERFSGSSVRYRADGLEDELYVDPCDTNLVCSPNPAVRGASSCQQACIIGIGCPSTDQQCVGPNQIEAVCRPIDHCDPLTGAGCATGLTCYLDLDGTGTRALTSCLPTPDEALPDGQGCNLSAGECRPGSSCWGPTRLPTSSWTLESLQCRATCSTLAIPGGGILDDLDAGPEEDGGLGTACSNGTACVDLSVSGVDVALIPASLGQCQ